jgi:hypothetical protein
VFSVREPSEERELVGLPELAISPLAERDARLVLGAAIRGRLDTGCGPVSSRRGGARWRYCSCPSG